MTKKTRNTRALIKKAAAKEFAEHGFSGARVERISSAAGVNKQLIFYYFHSKAGLFDAIVKSADEDLAATACGSPGDDREPFPSVFCGIFDSLASSEEMTRIIFFGPKMRDSRREDSIARMVGLLSDCVSRGQSLGHYKDDIDPDFVAKQAVILLVGFFATENTAFPNYEDNRKKWLRATGAMLNGWLSW